MKVETTIVLTDEQRMALGNNGEMASREIIRDWVKDIVAKEIPSVVKDYYERKIAEL